MMVVMDDTGMLTKDELATWERFTAVLELLPAALDAQLNADSEMTYFEYFCLTRLSLAQNQVLRVSALAAQTNAKLPRLSRVVTQLEKRGLVTRSTCPSDARATNVSLTDAGREKVARAAPGHESAVRRLVLDALEPAQVSELSDICGAMLSRLDPDRRMDVTSQCTKAASTQAARTPTASTRTPST